MSAGKLKQTGPGRYRWTPNQPGPVQLDDFTRAAFAYDDERMNAKSGLAGKNEINAARCRFEIEDEKKDRQMKGDQ